METLDVLLIGILCFMALWIAWTLYLTKDGILRKIMIGYFSAEAWLLAALILMISFPSHEYLILLLGILPKFVAKIFFYNYTNKK